MHAVRSGCSSFEEFLSVPARLKHSSGDTTDRESNSEAINLALDDGSAGKARRSERDGWTENSDAPRARWELGGADGPFYLIFLRPDGAARKDMSAAG